MGSSPEVIRLIEKVKSGENDAFASLVALYDQKILGLLRTMLDYSEDASDAYQEVFIRVWRALPNFRDDADFYTWLYRIAVNTALTIRKRRKTHRHRSLEGMQDSETLAPWTPEDPEAKPDHLLESKDLGAQIEEALGQLSLQQRAAFVLRFYEEFKMSEIAGIMDCTEGTVKNYLFRATRKLRKILKKYE